MKLSMMSYKRMQLDVSTEHNFRNKVGQILVFFLISFSAKSIKNFLCFGANH